MSDLTAIYEQMAAHVAAILPPAAEVAALTSLHQKLDAVLAASNLRTYQAIVPLNNTLKLVPNNQQQTTYQGMDCNTGQRLTGIDYLTQRVSDALLTPKGSQVLLRARGSDLYPQMDKPINEATKLAWVAAIAAALADPLAGVPDFKLSSINIKAVSAGLKVQLTGLWNSEPAELTL
ncbi:hypothetical protein [uncultured Thiothrix sp.]|uniref:hypothetical protein n=1 Tax=uncultured Thiothrix sp. TaxID=223185 RepID=UPI00260E17BD|nr:hypothetical protein [uncultured Thiothrix sp.]